MSVTVAVCRALAIAVVAVVLADPARAAAPPDCASVAAIAFGEPATEGTLSGDPNKPDCYLFAGAAGDRVRVRAVGTGSLLVGISEVTQPCPIVADGPDCVLPVNGTYTIWVGGTGSYGVSIQRLNDPIGCIRLSFGATPTAGAIEHRASWDCYRFEGSIGDRVRVWFAGLSTYGSAEVVRPNGTSMCGAPHVPGGGDGSCGRPLDADGLHTVLYRDSALDADPARTYMISVQRLNNPLGCLPLLYGGAPTAGSIGVPSETDCFRFDGEPGDRVAVRLIKTSGALLPVSEVLRPDGTFAPQVLPVVGPCVGFLPIGWEHTCLLDVKGRHTILVREHAVYAPPTGEYEISIRLTGSDGAPPAVAFSCDAPPGPYGWNTTEVSCVAEADDGTAGSGVREVRIRAQRRAELGPGASVVEEWEAQSAGDKATIAVSRDGITTLTATAVDKQGNQSGPVQHVVRLTRADFSVLAVELNQAVQVDPLGSAPRIPLVGGKPTVARVYIAVSGPLVVAGAGAEAKTVSARITVACGPRWPTVQSSVSVDLSKLDGGPALRRSIRSELAGTANLRFMPPVGPASCSIRAEVNDHAGPVPVLEGNRSNNEHQTFADFDKSGVLRVLTVGLRHSGRTGAVTRDAVDAMKAVFPLAPTRVHVLTGTATIQVDPGFRIRETNCFRFPRDPAVRRYCDVLRQLQRLKNDSGAHVAVGVLPHRPDCADASGVAVPDFDAALIIEGCPPRVLSLAHEVTHLVVGRIGHAAPTVLGAEALIVPQLTLAIGYRDFFEQYPPDNRSWVSLGTYRELLKGAGRLRTAAALTATAAAAARTLQSTPVRNLVSANGFVIPEFNAQAAGTLTIEVIARTRARRMAQAAARRLVLARARRTFAAAGRYNVKVRLTKRGRRFLRRTHTVKLALAFTFKETDGPRVRHTRSVTLRR